MFDGALPPHSGDEEEDLRPPAPRVIAERFLARAAIAMRSDLEVDWENSRENACAYPEWLAWVAEVVVPVCSPREREVLLRPRGDLSRQEVTDAGWAMENLSVLGWALGIGARPGMNPWYDFDPIYAAAGPGQTPEALLLDANFVPYDQVDIEATQYETVYWRLHTEVSARRQGGPEAHRYGSLLMRRARHLGILGPDDMGPDGDLRLEGVSVRDLPLTQLTLMNSIWMERLRAALWLAGTEEDWDHVTADTPVLFLQGDQWPPELQNKP